MTTTQTATHASCAAEYAARPLFVGGRIQADAYECPHHTGANPCPARPVTCGICGKAGARDISVGISNTGESVYRCAAHGG